MRSLTLVSSLLLTLPPRGCEVASVPPGNAPAACGCCRPSRPTPGGSCDRRAHQTCATDRCCCARGAEARPGAEDRQVAPPSFTRGWSARPARAVTALGGMAAPPTRTVPRHLMHCVWLC